MQRLTVRCQDVSKKKTKIPHAARNFILSQCSKTRQDRHIRLRAIAWDVIIYFIHLNEQLIDVFICAVVCARVLTCLSKHLFVGYSRNRPRPQQEINDMQS